MHLKQMFCAFFQAEIDHIGNGKDLHFTCFDFKGRKIRYPRAKGFDGFLRRARKRTRWQNRHMGSGYTTRDQFAA